jgi:hypothetical protein
MIAARIAFRTTGNFQADEERGRITLVATKAAFAALGIDARDEDEDTETDAADSAPADVEVEPKQRLKAARTKEPKSPRVRDGSKQAQLIAMLRRAKGATVDEIGEALSWQRHTVRGHRYDRDGGWNGIKQSNLHR